jgi:hypothetical protein
VYLLPNNRVSDEEVREEALPEAIKVYASTDQGYPGSRKMMLEK